MSGGRVRGALGVVFIGAAISGCLSEADGVSAEDLGEVTQQLCAALTLVAASATASPNDIHAELVIDGRVDTYWRSFGGTEDATLTVNLKELSVVTGVQLNWGEAYGVDYDIQVSANGSSWTTVASVRGNSGTGIREVAGLLNKARYVRMKGIKAGKLVQVPGGVAKAYDVRELKVFGDALACLKPDGAECATSAECAASHCGAWYKDDLDGDGYGVTPSPQKYCGETLGPAGYLSSKKDCCDSDATTRPGQSDFFTRPNACGSLDYNCSGSAEVEYVNGRINKCDSNLCTVSIGYASDSVPNCGESAPFLDKCFYKPASGTCSSINHNKVQRCH